MTQEKLSALATLSMDFSHGLQKQPFWNKPNIPKSSQITLY